MGGAFPPADRQPRGAVAGAVASASSPYIASGCSGDLAAKAACEKALYRRIVREDGVEAAFERLRAASQSDDLARTSCHQFTHHIGRAAAARYGSPTAAFSRAQQFCGMGFYHGVMEAVVARQGRRAALRGAPALCAPVAGQRSADHHGCVHGLGHGFMGVLAGDVPRSLRACDRLSDRGEREHCYNGVFMENLPDASRPGRRPRYIRPDQPLYPCTAVGWRYRDQCYQKQTSYALSVWAGDFATVFLLCSAVRERFRPACHQGIGRNGLEVALRRTGVDRRQVDSVRVICMLGPGYAARLSCIVGAAKYFVLYRGGDAQARALCQAVDADLRAVCLPTIEQYHRLAFPRLVGSAGGA